MTLINLKDKIVAQSGAKTYKTQQFADDIDANFEELELIAEQYEDSLNSRKDSVVYDDVTRDFTVTNNFFGADVLDQIRIGVFDQSNDLLYYLDASDIRFKENGDAANIYGITTDTVKNLSGTDYTIKAADFGTVRAIFKKFYYSHKKVADVSSWELSRYFFLGSEIFPAFKAYDSESGNVTERETTAVDRYESVLFDTSENHPVNGVYIDVTVSADSATKTVTFETPVQYLQSGDVFKDTTGVLGSVDDVYTVDSVTLNAAGETTSIVITESIQDTPSGTSISLRNEIDLAEDYLISVSGYKPVTYISQTESQTLSKNWSGDVGTNIESFWHWQMRLFFCAIQYGTLNIQTALGAGKTGSTSDYRYVSVTGLFDEDGVTNAVDNTSDDQFQGGSLTWGLENTYGNVWKWMVALYVVDWKVKLTYNNSQFADVDLHFSTGMTLPSSNGYWGGVMNNIAFLPSSVDGSSSDGIGDYFYQSSGTRVGRSGGYLYVGSDAGVAYLYVGFSASFRGWSIGARAASYK